MNIASSSSPRRSRRLAIRRELMLPCQAVRLSDFKLIATATLDVSVDGVLLPVAFPILTGEPIIVSFQIPGAWIDAEAIVTRVVHGRRPGDDGLAVGAIFDVISPASRAALGRRCSISLIAATALRYCAAKPARLCWNGPAMPSFCRLICTVICDPDSIN